MEEEGSPPPHWLPLVGEGSPRISQVIFLIYCLLNGLGTRVCMGGVGGPPDLEGLHTA